ncbi:hypothetical protein ABIC55_001143 [Sporosarcina psychrophila]|uniref:Uncharacterized protein n=1 Tax=Sporosarcina psychrophila TaxID=1476 RepID=A0ABV2K7L1_SPOPS|nr:hypothetical protein AZE41_15820 [Sporosarcina psychrophila]
MTNLDSTLDIELVISKISSDQSRSFQTTLKDFQTLLNEDKLEDSILKNVSSIYYVLEKLHKEKKIHRREFNQRTKSLINIVLLAKDINANNIRISKS